MGRGVAHHGQLIRLDLTRHDGAIRLDIDALFETAWLASLGAEPNATLWEVPAHRAERIRGKDRILADDAAGEYHAIIRHVGSGAQYYFLT